MKRKREGKGKGKGKGERRRGNTKRKKYQKGQRIESSLTNITLETYPKDLELLVLLLLLVVVVVVRCSEYTLFFKHI